MRRGIIFPEYGRSPLWIWIKSESEDGRESLNLEDHLMTSSQSSKVLHLFIQHNQSRKRALSDTLAISYREKDVDSDPWINQSIHTLAKDSTAFLWYGPIIVMKKLGLGTDSAACGDMDLTDYRDAIDSLIYDYLPGGSTDLESASSSQSFHSARTVRGVRISCNGDMNVLGADKFIPVDVSTVDSIFEADMSAASEMVGVPVRVRKILPHPAWGNSGTVDIYGNQQITRLFRGMDPEKDDFGWAPSHWDLGVGSVLLVRDDGKDIWPKQVEALCYYISEHNQESLEDAVEHRDMFDSNVEVDKWITLFTPDKFRAFFAEFKASKVAKDARWTSAESPV